LTCGFLLISNDHSLWICVEDFFWRMYFFFLWLHMYVVHILMIVILHHTIFAWHFLGVGHLAICSSQYPKKLKTFSLNVYLLVYVMRKPIISNLVLSTKPVANLHCSRDQYNTITAQNYHFYTIWGYQNLPRPYEQIHRKFATDLVWYPKWHFVIKDIHHKHNLLEMSVVIQITSIFK